VRNPQLTSSPLPSSTETLNTAPGALPAPSPSSLLLFPLFPSTSSPGPHTPPGPGRPPALSLPPWPCVAPGGAALLHWALGLRGCAAPSCLVPAWNGEVDRRVRLLCVAPTLPESPLLLSSCRGSQMQRRQGEEELPGARWIGGRFREAKGLTRMG